jgi:hypothetical protein
MLSNKLDFDSEAEGDLYIWRVDVRKSPFVAIVSFSGIKVGCMPIVANYDNTFQRYRDKIEKFRGKADHSMLLTSAFIKTHTQ